MSLPLDPATFAPMEALAVDALPEGEGWQYEPKWDGFRCLAWRDGDRVELRSKSLQPLGRYFPDIVSLLEALAPRRFGLDGELVVPVGGRLSFSELQLRLHPAESRVRKLAAAHPATLMAFDLLVDGKGRDLTGKPLAERRTALERFVAALDPPPARLLLSPAALSRGQADAWLGELGASLDGIVAKERGAPYAAGERCHMVKWKRQKTADCVVGGFRYEKNERLVGSLLLGLYDDDGKLDHVGFAAGLKRAGKPALTRRLEALAGGSGFTGKAPGGPSRWSTERSAEWVALRPELVVEVRYDHVTDARFRHGTQLLRFRPEKAPAQCRLDQILR